VTDIESSWNGQVCERPERSAPSIGRARLLAGRMTIGGIGASSVGERYGPRDAGPTSFGCLEPVPVHTGINNS
jgi:hypothetical protein